MFTIEVQDNGVQALQALSDRVGNLRPHLQGIGEDIMERSKERFNTGTGPDGQRWQGNSLATIQAMIARQSGAFAAFSNVKTRKEGVARVGNKKGFYLKDGTTLSKKAQTMLMGKKVLIGESRDLSRQFHVHADRASVTVSNTMAYAAMQQFGGKKSAFPNLWGDIPARPFLPIKQNGELYPAERTKILDAINDYLAGK